MNQNKLFSWAFAVTKYSFAMAALWLIFRSMAVKFGLERIVDVALPVAILGLALMEGHRFHRQTNQAEADHENKN
jgi:hypothetical protein